MAIVLKATYSTGLTQAGLSSHRFSLSLRTKVADLTQVETESARLYAVLQASVANALQNLGSMPHNAGGKGEWHRRSLGRYQNHDTWACSRKQQKLLRRFIANCNLDWSFIERAAQEQFGKPVRALNQKSCGDRTRRPNGWKSSKTRANSAARRR